MFPDNRSSHSFFDFPLTAGDLFAQLYDTERPFLDAICETRQFEKGNEIFSCGDEPTHIYILRCGSVTLIHNERAPDTFTTCPPRSERIFGVIETLSDSVFDATLITATLCDVRVVPREAFINLLVHRPQLCFQLARLVSTRYQHTIKLISSL
ncbi:MAG: cyclic nucleotide-binding domain-containing protein [Pyrinomonadaceae bacterium]|nr:cyclic nucleotide-binding domain-containing protein [Pyrinomonadaceae bacterium]MBP6211564.1 cyclic nucleotide-binding domain-containing protein [Pyrinomonadaceae bacterium]